MEMIAVSSWVVLGVFLIGYTFIILEHTFHINKATSALMTAVLMWLVIFVASDLSHKNHMEFLEGQLSDITQVVLFLMGALAIVEIINAHRGFSFVTKFFSFKKKWQLFWVIGLITFFLSAILDNLTTTIVMVTLLSRVVPHTIDRWLIGSGVVVAANAGGAWTPIGDVTTTMLWIGGQLDATNIITHLFLPSLASMLISYIFLSFWMKGNLETNLEGLKEPSEPFAKSILIMGVALLIFVPFFKVLTGLPPFMGMLFGLSVLWIYTDILHYRHMDRKHLRVVSIIREIDLSSIIFFIGILLAVGALEEAGLLAMLANGLQQAIGNQALIAGSIGILSAIVDNVPLVAASMGMYKLSAYPPNSSFWEMIAYCAGTGGSLLVIGSAAGVVFMGIEKVTFFWYLKRITLPALAGYVGGLVVYLLV